MRELFRNKQGQGLVEFGLIIAGVALICAAAISVFGHKTSDLIAAIAAVLPGAAAEDNAPIISGRLIETTGANDGAIALDLGAIVDGNNSSRLEQNVLGGPAGGNFGGLILETQPNSPPSSPPETPSPPDTSNPPDTPGLPVRPTRPNVPPGRPNPPANPPANPPGNPPGVPFTPG